MIGTSILHYKISQKLGEGGMGVVYKAEDIKLKREVAIKFLPGHVAANSEERERFKIEAQAAAALNHPNITHIYAIEETAEHIFIVMEYIDGRELRDLIKTWYNSPSSLPSLREILDIASQITAGLNVAHGKGIVHRDIKSSNIMRTTEGLIKIMDFGLARVRGGSQVTKVGTTLGTAAYMSPEQARGENVDHRSDLWSCGIVLYEMLSGKLPFQGDYDAAISYAIIHDEPRPLENYSPGLPAGLLSLITKCMQKEPGKRYEKAVEIAADLNQINHLPEINREEISSPKIKNRHAGPLNSTVSDNPGGQKNLLNLKYIFGFIALAAILLIVGFFWNNSSEEEMSGSAARKKLVVLPFKNLGSSEQDYFAEGITGEITSRLSGLSSLSVIARSSAMHYKDSAKSLEQIGKELGVDFILEGTIQWETNREGIRRVRINPELIRIDDLTQIWSEPYEVDFSGTFQLQSSIAAKVAKALDVKLGRTESKTLTENLTQNSDAFDYYLKGMRYISNSYDEQNFRVAEDMFQKAINLDPDFAAAYAQLANVQVDIYWFHYDHSREQVEKARKNLDRAMALDPDLSVVRTASGWYEYHALLNYETAINEFNSAIASQPNNVDAYTGIAAVLRRQGKYEEAINYFLKAVEIDPRSAASNDQTGETYLLLRQFDQAMLYINRAISLSPDVVGAYRVKSEIILTNDCDTKQAKRVIEDAWRKKIGVNDPTLIEVMIRIELFDRNLAGTLKQINKISVYDDQFYYLPQTFMIAYSNLVLGEAELAKPYFEKASADLLEMLTKLPDEPRYLSAIGLTYAGLGQTEKAVRAGKKAVEIMPVSVEAWRGGVRILDLAKIYTLVGQQEQAIDQIEQIISIPSTLSVALLQNDPVWDSLRNNPRFNQLIDKYKQK